MEQEPQQHKSEAEVTSGPTTYTNPVFVHEDSPTAADLDQPLSLHVPDRTADLDHDRLTPPPNTGVRRHSSIADIVIALGASSPTNPSSRRNSDNPDVVVIKTNRKFTYDFVHPYGKSHSIIDELLDPESTDTKGNKMSGSMAKLVVWIVISLFMAGFAAGVILGAESFEWGSRNGTTLAVPSNISCYWRTLLYRRSRGTYRF